MYIHVHCIRYLHVTVSDIEPKKFVNAHKVQLYMYIDRGVWALSLFMCFYYTHVHVHGPAHWLTSFITSRPVCVYSCSQLRELWFNDLFMHIMYIEHRYSILQYLPIGEPFDIGWHQHGSVGGAIR